VCAANETSKAACINRARAARVTRTGKLKIHAAGADDDFSDHLADEHYGDK